jgi:uncharacterized Fe-S radical SAM superfamily protein PflX
MKSVMEKPSRFEEFKEWLDDTWWSIRLPFREFKESCQQIIKWFPIIWETRDWDYHYMEIMMMHKIKFIRESMVSSDRHLKVETEAKHMRVAELLLERLINQNYINNRGYGTHELCKCDQAQKEADRRSEEFEKNNPDARLFPCECPFCDYCQKYGLKHHGKVEKYDREYLYNLIAKRHQYWWD